MPASSWRRASANIRWAAFVAEYAAAPGKERSPAPEDITTMWPLPRISRWGSAALIV